MKKRAILVVVLLVAVSVACRGNAAEPTGGGAAADATYYDLEVAAISATVGAAAALVIVVTPKPGFKYNLEFPAALSVAAADTHLVHFEKTRVRRGDAEIVASEQRATLSLPLTARKAGTEQLSATVSFSVCTEKTCHVFRNRTVEATITVD